jgi:hypothetical protein
MRYDKLRNMNDATLGYAAPRKRQLLPNDDMLIMLLSLSVTHFHSAELTYTTTSAILRIFPTIF